MGYDVAGGFPTATATTPAIVAIAPNTPAGVGWSNRLKIALTAPGFVSVVEAAPATIAASPTHQAWLVLTLSSGFTLGSPAG